MNVYYNIIIHNTTILKRNTLSTLFLKKNITQWQKMNKHMIRNMYKMY